MSDLEQGKEIQRMMVSIMENFKEGKETEFTVALLRSLAQLIYMYGPEDTEGEDFVAQYYSLTNAFDQVQGTDDLEKVPAMVTVTFDLPTIANMAVPTGLADLGEGEIFGYGFKRELVDKSIDTLLGLDDNDDSSEESVTVH